jgi:hypothetical protein
MVSGRAVTPACQNRPGGILDYWHPGRETACSNNPEQQSRATIHSNNPQQRSRTPHFSESYPLNFAEIPTLPQPCPLENQAISGKVEQ